jgi:hypothetical protein
MPRVGSIGLKFVEGVFALFGVYALYYQVADPRVSIATVGTSPLSMLYINIELLNESHLVPMKKISIVAEFGARGGAVFDHVPMQSDLSEVKELRSRDLVFVGFRAPFDTPPRAYTAATACVIVTYETILGKRRREFGFYRTGGEEPSPWLRRSCGDDPVQQDPKARRFPT